MKSHVAADRKRRLKTSPANSAILQSLRENIGGRHAAAIFAACFIWRCMLRWRLVMQCRCKRQSSSPSSKSLGVLLLVFASIPMSVDQTSCSQVVAAEETTSADEKALLFYTEWLDKHPKDVPSYLGRARIFWKRGKKEEAARDLAAAGSLDSYLAEVTQASLYLASGEKEKAEHMLSEAIAAEPIRYNAYLERANLRLSQNDKQAALADLTSALAHCPKGSLMGCECVYKRADIFFDLGRYHEAIRDASDAINRKSAANQRDTEIGLDVLPADPRHFFLRGFAYAKVGDYQRAIADFAVCESTGVLWPELFLKRADCYRELGDMEREKADRKKAHGLEASQK